MDHLLIPRQVNPNSCIAPYQYWTCRQSSTQDEYSGCCLSDACRNGGSCPEEDQQQVFPTSSTSTRPTPTSLGPTTTTAPEFSSPTTLSSQSPSARTTELGIITTTVLSTPSVGTNSLVADNTGLPNSTSAASSTPATSHKTAIIAGAVAGAIILILIGIIIFLLRRRRQNKIEHAADPAYVEKPTFPFHRASAASTIPTPGFFASKPPTNPPTHPTPYYPEHQPDMAELESDIVSSPSELSSGTPRLDPRVSGVSSSAWSPSEDSEVSYGSTVAVLSPGYAQGSAYGAGGHSRQGSAHGGHGHSGPESPLHTAHGSHNQNAHPPTQLRGGEYPSLRANLHSLRRPVPQSPVDGAHAGGQQRSRHVMSWANYDDVGAGAGAAGGGARR